MIKWITGLEKDKTTKTHRNRTNEKMGWKWKASQNKWEKTHEKKD